MTSPGREALAEAARCETGGQRRCARCDWPMITRYRGEGCPQGFRKHMAREHCLTCYRRVFVAPRVPPRGRWGRASMRSDVDEIAVERLVRGDFTGTPTVGELRAATTYLHRCGYSARQIAVRIGVTPRTVQRHRAALRAAA